MEVDTTAWPIVTIDELVAFHVRFVIGQHGGNLTSAAKVLGIHRRTLHRMIARNPSLLTANETAH
jgi:ActR/RegA family two-component response regulator